MRQVSVKQNVLHLLALLHATALPEIQIHPRLFPLCTQWISLLEFLSGNQSFYIHMYPGFSVPFIEVPSLSMFTLSSLFYLFTVQGEKEKDDWICHITS